MAKLKTSCPHCGELLLVRDSFRGRELKCPYCKRLLLVPALSGLPAALPRRCRTRRKIILAAGLIAFAWFVAAIASTVMWFTWPARIHWPDRRPIGELFLASHVYSSATNPRGWFNDPKLNVTGPGGAQRFRKALMDYANRSIAILKRSDAQGVIVWDLAGAQFSRQATSIGDPRALDRLAPEMASASDEFFARLRNAGLRVGVTIRPQRLVFGEGGVPRQKFVFNLKKVLEEKIDYARKRWGATLFYVDSNDGFWRPDELWQLRSLAAERPDILLIPEHHWLPYSGFTAPYVALRKEPSAAASHWTRKFFPNSFQVLDIGGDSDNRAAISTAHLNGDVLLFRAWHESPGCRILEKFAAEESGPPTGSNRLSLPQ